MKRSGIRWVLRCGLILGVGLGLGCSDDGAEPTAGSAGKGAREAASAKPANPATPSTQHPTTMPGNASSPAAPDVDEPVSLSQEELIAGGRAVYNANCIACHSMDPTKDGALGPAVSGSPLALLETRVLRGEYPEGYEPKRTTRVMIPLPHLEPRLAELAAYLNSLD